MILRALSALALLIAAPASAQMQFSQARTGSIVLCQGATTASHTGDTLEFTAATCTIPANTMGANGQVEVVALFSYTNSANIKNLRVRLGGTQMSSTSATTSASTQNYTRIANRNATNSQVSFASITAGFSASSNAPVTATIDTTAAADITITEQLATSTETVALESYIVRVYPKG